MRKPGGYGLMVHPDKTVEHDTFTCGHCNKVVAVKPMCDPAELGDFCRGCMKYICPSCSGKGCQPFMRKLEQQEARYHALRSYGMT